MPLDLSADPLPLAYDAAGELRVVGTRVRLASLVEAFRQGATAEEITQQYPSVDLPTVYAVIAFYLRRRPEVERFLDERSRAGAAAQATARERGGDGVGLRERLLARRAAGRASA